MFLKNFRGLLFRLVSVALVSASFAQFSFAGVVGTEYLVEADARSVSLGRVEAFLARADVAQQLEDLGVDKATIDARLSGLTNAELLVLEDRIGRVAVGDHQVRIIKGGTVCV